MTVMKDADLVRIYNDGFLNPEDLPDSERPRFLWMVPAFASRADEMYSQHKSGPVDLELWSQCRDAVVSQRSN